MVNNFNYQEKYKCVKDTVGFSFARMNDATDVLKHEILKSIGKKTDKPKADNRREYIKSAFRTD